MSVKLTAAGKQCKLCLKKGGPCHIHAGKVQKIAAKKPSAKKTAVKKTAKTARSKTAKAKFGKGKVKIVSDGVDRFATLPKDALVMILLEMDRPELTKIRKLSKRARLLSDSAAFQEQYHAKHPTTFFTGEVYIKNRVVYERQAYIIHDTHGKSVLIYGRDAGEGNRPYFLIEWMGYRTTALPKKVSPKARKPAHLAEDVKQSNYKPLLNAKTQIQSHKTIIAEATNHLISELESGGDRYDIYFE